MNKTATLLVKGLLFTFVFIFKLCHTILVIDFILILVLSLCFKRLLCFVAKVLFICMQIIPNDNNIRIVPLAGGQLRCNSKGDKFFWGSIKNTSRSHYQPRERTVNARTVDAE